MKKNRMLRLASALLILTLLTTSVIGGTFAKYVSTGSVSDTARVAKWGVEIKTSGTLYSDAYAKVDNDNADASNIPAAWSNDSINNNSITVATVSDGNENIIAPGTKSYANGLSFGVAGKPEVAVNVKATIKAEDIFLKAGTYGVLVPATVSDTESLKKVINDQGSEGAVYEVTTTDDTKTFVKLVANTASYKADTNVSYYILKDKVSFADNDYYPVVYTLDGNTKLDDTTAVKIATAIAKQINNKTDATATTGSTDFKTEFQITDLVLPANTDLGGDSGLSLDDENIKWEWAFEDTTSTDDDKKARDEKDTILGDLMALRADTTNAIDYIIVQINTDNVLELVPKTDDGDYTVTAGTEVVANLNTKFDINLTMTQVD